MLLNNLDVSQQPDLFRLNCPNNFFTELDTSQNPNLASLIFRGNQISNYDGSNNPALQIIDCSDNALVNLNLKNGFNTNIQRMFAYDNPNLTCIQVDDENYSNAQICNLASNLGWCKDETASYSEDCQLTTKDFTTTDFKLFPNPAQNVLNIQSQEQIDSVRIFTLEGRLLLQTANPSIDISQLKAGLYLVQIMAQGQTATKKFLKN
tara:strand:- start:19 stop:639 length:621 start_codon:yes stop_codon:yes gene_type:complete